ncbi:hypothetical protein A1O7_09245 [Cladophialophora yegresii CBS 114405]|uniref:Uncharacterized protein n=1 Tax=Cladophialophora yegresii CBS 114405 TaxID=1182544 RepID=W9W5S0_9EURO|nr:uncharacterized protein A1O7_09245 [Cladophialophora yegresii CBS 114405]EXJ53909.1 hypothetical protein A1O7_09245 [Cladophialophora yegresii CBS 114405]
MDNSQEQAISRQRTRDHFQQREAERGSLKHKQPIIKTAEQQAQPPKQKQQQNQSQQQGGVVWTPNAMARQTRLLTASRGKCPVFDENIWAEDRCSQRPNHDGSVSPKTRVGKDESQFQRGCSNGNGNHNMKTMSGTRPQGCWEHGADKDKPYNTTASTRKEAS